MLSINVTIYKRLWCSIVYLIVPEVFIQNNTVIIQSAVEYLSYNCTAIQYPNNGILKKNIYICPSRKSVFPSES